MNIWQKFNNLKEPYRFMVFFLGIAIPSLAGIPLIGWFFDVPLAIGQVVGLLLMSVLALWKSWVER